MALTAKGKNRNMFAKKNTQPEEQVLQDIMDEQLSDTLHRLKPSSFSLRVYLSELHDIE
jgi:hypothetical protein